ncbi:MAG: hypothetical protein HC837_11600 [Chloroflexaceae bacterium]|nr:hypothetical protein [Chloroflexaceae bacterium]
MYRNVIITGVIGLSLLMLISFSTRSQAQTQTICFPETGYCMTGRIAEYWQTQGALPVFGFPIGPQQPAFVEGKVVELQWFERNRLELHPQNPSPYDVLLGRLGADRLEQQGRNWLDFPPGEPQEGCRSFPETRHTICEPFLSAWRASGLEFDGDPNSKSEFENLALFGYPLSEPMTEIIEGESYTVQWFERTRFEWHPENEPPYQVLFGRLGVEVQGTPLPPQPTTTPTLTHTAGPSPTPTATITATATLTPSVTASRHQHCRRHRQPQPAQPRPQALLPRRQPIPLAHRPTPTGTPRPETSLRVQKLASVSQIAPGERFRYTIGIFTDSDVVRSARMQDTLAAELLIQQVQPPGACTVEGQQVDCTLPVRQNIEAVITIEVQVKEQTADGTVLSNQAHVTGHGDAAVSEEVKVRVRQP